VAYRLAYYNSNVLKFFLEDVIAPFHLEYFIKTFVQANHPRFKLELYGNHEALSTGML
jgi:hypothetical protein